MSRKFLAVGADVKQAGLVIQRSQNGGRELRDFIRNPRAADAVRAREGRNIAIGDLHNRAATDRELKDVTTASDSCNALTLVELHGREPRTLAAHFEELATTPEGS